MRVISGLAGGRRLDAPKADDIVRPTTDRVKEALFSIINFDIPSSRVLDLFSGSGQLGIEALSRGADYAVFIDSDRTAASLTETNLKRCGLFEKAKVHRGDCFAFLNGAPDLFDIVFVDPPYHLGLYEKSLKAVSKKITARGIIACEHPIEIKLPKLDGFKSKDYKYGKIIVTVYRNEVINNE